MIERIKLNSVSSDKKQPQQKQPTFKGIESGLIWAIQQCEQKPMVNVSVVDIATAIGPRTIYDTVKTNPIAGFETLRREGSGLVINCLIPSFIVLGFASLLQKPIMGAKSKMGGSWANEEAIRTIAKYYQEAKGEGETRIINAYANMLNDASGMNGKKLVNFSDKKFNFAESIEEFAKHSMNPTKKSSKEIKEAIGKIAKQTLVTEHVQIGKGKNAYKGSLKSILEESPRIFQEFIKHNIKDAADIEKFVKKSTKLVTAKSLLGLGVIIPLAIAAQPINRWITAKTSGKKGAPIYRDFKDSEEKVLTPEEKSKLFGKKLISAGMMVGVALLSIMKKPSLAMLKDITQFKGIFPTLDQARLISTATFASRMMAAEDENELREATVRDIATFSAFYFLNDYVAKGIATFIQKHNPKHKLINVLKPLDKDANIFKKFWHWAKDTSLKSSDEIASVATKKMRSWCQLGNIGFSLVALGILIPMITRKKTDKAHEEELRKKGVDPKVVAQYYPPFAMNIAHSNSAKKTYEMFFTAK